MLARDFRKFCLRHHILVILIKTEFLRAKMFNVGHNLLICVNNKNLHKMLKIKQMLSKLSRLLLYVVSHNAGN